MNMLSKNVVKTYVGDVVHIEFLGPDINENSDISWSCDEKVAKIRVFPEFRNSILVSVWNVGEGFVKAEYCGKTYTSSVFARETMSNDGKLNYYLADLHTHTSIIHEHDKFKLHETENIEDYISAISKDEVLDLAVITDHACVTNDFDFSRGFKLAKTNAGPIIFAGAESEISFVETDRFGIPQRHSGEIVTLMSAGYTSSSTYEDFEESFKYSQAPIAIFAHPNIIGYSTPGIWNFDFSNHNSEYMKYIVCGIEMGSGSDGKCNILHEYAISQALDAGFKVSTTCSSDVHGPEYGSDCIPGKTVIMATERTAEAFHNAIRQNRFYATESGDVRLKYSVNGSDAPTTLDITDTYSFKIELDTFSKSKETMPIICQVISDYGKRVFECDIKEKTTEFTIKSDSARYFYIRFIDSEGAKTWSMPVWCGREFDTPQKVKLTPVNPAQLKAYLDTTDISAIVDGNPENAVYFDKHNPEIIIDLGREESVSAVGYYHLIIKNTGTDENKKIPSKMGMLVSEYKIYTSLDGTNYEFAAHKYSQALSGEVITSFETRMARYVKFEVVSNVGRLSHRKKYKDSNTAIANLAVFKSE